MSKTKYFNIKVIISFFLSILLMSMIAVVIASPDLEKDIKDDLSVYINYLNNGDISEYYNMYNTRKLNDIEKSLFYDKIKDTTKVVENELDTFKKFKLQIKINDVKILRKVNSNIYLCSLDINYKSRENIDTTKTIKKSDKYILKIIYLGKDNGYKILLPFNSIDKDFSTSNIFTYLENLYKNNKAKEIEEQRLLEEEKEKESDANSDDTSISEDDNENNINDVENSENESDLNSTNSSDTMTNSSDTMYVDEYGLDYNTGNNSETNNLENNDGNAL